MTAMGIPMLWIGEEFGEHKRKSKTVTQPNKIAWSLLEQDQNHNLFEYYKKLIALRTQNPALQSDNIEFFHKNADAKVLAYVRWHQQGDRVVVVVNFSDQNLARYKVETENVMSLQKTSLQNWRDLFTNTKVAAADDGLVIDLPQYSALVFVFQAAS